MSRNGAGLYSLPAGNPVITGTTISSTWANNTLSDIATALTQSVANDGQTPISANIPLNNHKLTGVQAGSTTGDALIFGQSMTTLDGLTLTDDLTVTNADINISGGTVNEAQGADIASATTINLDTATGNFVNITGTTEIDAVTLTAGRSRIGRFTGILLLKNSANLVVQGGADITTAANDFALFVSGTSNIVYVEYFRASGAPIVSPSVQAIVGAATRLRASLTAAGASVTFTADQVMVGVALSGTYMQLPNFNKTFNSGTTGAGGMDAGPLPTSGFVSIYAIAKTDGTQSILGVNAATSSGTIYSGANMPSGYTLSALLAIWPTNSTPAMKPGFWKDRFMYYQAPVLIFTATNGPTSLTSQSISAAVPAPARSATAIFSATTASSTPAAYSVAGDSSGSGMQSNFATNVNGSTKALPGGLASSQVATTFDNVPIITAQTLFWMESAAFTTNALNISGYEI